MTAITGDLESVLALFGSFFPGQLLCYYLILPTTLGSKAKTRELEVFNATFQSYCFWVCRWWQQMTEMSSFSL